MIDPDGNADGFQIDAGLRIRGGWSRNPEFFKHAFRLFFRGDYGDAKLRYPLFGSEGASEFDMVGLRSDSNLDWSRETEFNLGRQFTFVRDVFARDTQGAMGQAYTRSRYYHLYLNGTYWGIYQTQERSEKSFGASYFGGDKEGYDVVKSANHVGGFTTEASDGTLEAFKALWDRAREIGLRDPSDAHLLALEGRGPDGSRDPSLPVLLDIDNPIDYMHFFRGGALTDAACIERFQRRADEMRAAVRAHTARWADARYAALDRRPSGCGQITRRRPPGRSVRVGTDMPMPPARWHR